MKNIHDISRQIHVTFVKLIAAGGGDVVGGVVVAETIDAWCAHTQVAFPALGVPGG
jgi:hypothetical protein